MAANAAQTPPNASASSQTLSVPTITHYRWPRTIIARFTARRTIRSASFVGLAFITIIIAKTTGYAAAYPTAHDRLTAASIYTGNLGLIALYGAPYHLETTTGFAVWYTLCIGGLLGSIWAYLVATRIFRGEESAGRWELLLTSLTTSRRAAAGTLAGLAASLGLFYAITAIALIAIGRLHDMQFATGPALYFALAAVSGAIMFMAVGAFSSQLMPTRARAAGLATTIFAASFLLRAAGDITSAKWLLNITPLGWIEHLQPLFQPQPLWLLPIAGFTLALAGATILLAGHRDLGASYFADHDTARPHTGLLRGPFIAALRFTRGTTISWLAGLTVFMAFFGALTNTAAQAFSNSTGAQRILDSLAGVTQDTASRTFLGIAYLLAILIVMAYAANAVSALRNDEAQGYLDNLLVRPISRQRWFWGRAALIGVGACAAGLLAALGSWLGLTGHHELIPFADLIKAGLNAIPPAIFVLGLGLATFGLLPRLTTTVAYGYIAWSFLIQLLSSGLNLNHWLLDTSIFTHIALTPATDPKWGTNWVLITLGITLTLIGALAFNRRDLAPE